MDYDPARIIEHVVEKMIRACNNELQRAMILWEFYSKQQGDRRMARRNLATSLLVALLATLERRKQYRPAFNRLAQGVVSTKMQ